MKYHVGLLTHPQINNPLPAPVSWYAPVFHANVFCTAVVEQIALMQAHKHEAQLAMTGYMEDGVLKIGPDKSVRNCYIFGEPHLVAQTRTLFDEVAVLAWNNFSFSAAKPVGEEWQLLVYDKEGFFVPHYDDSRGETYNGKHYLWRDRPSRSMTLLIYLNDNYEGGHITFPCILDEQNQPLRIKPKAGDAVAFPSHEVFTHHVEPVTSGTRYVVSRWFDDVDWYRKYTPVQEALRAGLLNATAAWQVDASGVRDIQLSMLGADVEDSIRDTAVSAVWDVLEQDLCFGHTLCGATAFMSRAGAQAVVHNSSADRNSFFTVVIVDSNDDYVAMRRSTQEGLVDCKMLRPWDIVQTQANIDVQVIPPTTGSTRYILFASKRVYQMHPNERPADFL